MHCKKEIFIPQEFERYLIMKSEVLFVEVRCVRLDSFATRQDARGKSFKQRWPDRGLFSFNYRAGREFVIPNDPNTLVNAPDDITLQGIGDER